MELVGEPERLGDLAIRQPGAAPQQLPCGDDALLCAVAGGGDPDDVPEPLAKGLVGDAELERDLTRLQRSYEVRGHQRAGAADPVGRLRVGRRERALGHELDQQPQEGEHLPPAARAVVLDGGDVFEQGSHARVPARRPARLAVNMTTALNGVLDARPVLGDVVVVSGLGVIGQLIAQLVRRCGVAAVIGVDVSEHRRELAVSLGADAAFAPDEAAERVRDLAQRGADVAIEVSGAAPAVQTAIRAVGFCGRVITVSWYREPVASLNLSDEYFHNRVRISSSNLDVINPELTPAWTDERIAAYAASLVPRLALAPLFTHDFPVHRAGDAYRAVDEAAEGLVQCTLSYA